MSTPTKQPVKRPTGVALTLTGVCTLCCLLSMAVYGSSKAVAPTTDISVASKASQQFETVTPVKISTTGQNAELNTDDRFTLDLDGFTQDTVPLKITNGGLNATEAWLVLDRAQNGIWVHNALDNDDVFGDHGGLVANGYADLRKTFQHEIKTAPNGELYIDLSGYNWFGEIRLAVCRALLGDKTPYSTYDLQLLSVDRRLIPARSIVNKIYLDPQSVAEYDFKRQNVILKRGKVEYKDGHTAESADQTFIFVDGVIRKLSPEEEAMIRAQLKQQGELK